MITAANVRDWTDEKLRRKADQESEMIGLAYRDKDMADVEKRRRNLTIINQEIQSRQ